MQATLLIELLTEELPPKALKELAFAFADKVTDGLLLERLVQRAASNPVPLFDPSKLLATPRRLTILVPNVLASAEDISKEVDGPPVTAKPEAVTGFAKKQGVDSSALQQREGPKGKIYFAKVTLKGATLDVALAGIVTDALKKLPVPKVMRWSAGDAQFVRPVHGLIMLHGNRVVPGKVLGIESGNTTLGHRFLSKGSIVISSADAYEATLETQGRVITEFRKRKERIRAELEKQAAGATLLGDDALLNEVTALVEWPAVYAGTFDKTFLEVPQECLVLSMQQHQRYFPLADANGKLLNRFLMVSNMQIADPENIVRGNERVLHARLSDAKFFYDQDRRERLEDRVPRLANMVYHNMSGRQLERVERLRATAEWVSKEAGLSSTDWVGRAAYLSKADLTTGMVGEFPELQGVMGGYYALNDKEPGDIPNAIREHYYPRFASDQLPSTPTGICLALADKIFSLAALTRAGERASAEKDPFGFRRTAIGITRILIEKEIQLDLYAAIEFASRLLDQNFSESTSIYLKQQWEQRTAHEHGDKMFGYGTVTTPYNPNVTEYAFMFVIDRLRFYLREQGWKHDLVEAVLALAPRRFIEILPRLEAVKIFQTLPEWQSLAAANKRIRNILSKSEPPSEDTFSASKLVEPAENNLHKAFLGIERITEEKFAAGKFADALVSLASLKAPVDEFFNGVMVNVHDSDLRNNRLVLLMQLDQVMNRVADISKLAVEK